MAEADRSIAVLGAGVSGLATAWFLERKGFRVRVFEAGAKPGGVIRSEREEGYLVESGPNSTLSNTTVLDRLIEDLDLPEALAEAGSDASKRFIVKHGEPLAMPMGPLQFARTPLFSARGKLRLFAEPFIGRATEEETIAQFVQRRLGRDFLDWAIDPFISGVYAGDPHKLSVRAAVRKIYALEKEHRSLILGALKRVLSGKKSGPQPTGRLISFDDGMQVLTDRLAERLKGGVETGAALESLERGETGWTLRFRDREEPLRFGSVVLALPAPEAARLLEPLAAEAARLAREIDYPPVASVALGFRREQIRHPLDGFGFLIPRREEIETLGTLFSSSLFPRRAPEGQVLLTSFIGGARNRSVGEASEADLEARVLRDIRPLLGIEGEPEFRRITRWAKAIPQYNLGHLERVARIRAAIAPYPGLYLRGNWLDGISVSDCVRTASEFVENLDQVPSAD